MGNVNIISSSSTQLYYTAIYTARIALLRKIIRFDNYYDLYIFYKHRMGMGAVHAAGTAAGWGQGLPGGPQLPPHHATTVTAPPGVQAAPPPPPPPAQMMAYPMQQFQVTITLSIPSVHACKCAPQLLCDVCWLTLECFAFYILLHLAPVTSKSNFVGAGIGL